MKQVGWYLTTLAEGGWEEKQFSQPQNFTQGRWEKIANALQASAEELSLLHVWTARLDAWGGINTCPCMNKDYSLPTRRRALRRQPAAGKHRQQWLHPSLAGFPAGSHQALCIYGKLCSNSAPKEHLRVRSSSSVCCATGHQQWTENGSHKWVHQVQRT